MSPLRFNLVNRIKSTIRGQEHLTHILQSAAWSLSGEVIGRGSALLAGFVAAHLLEVTGFGQLGMIRSTIGTFSVLAGFGLGITATRYVARYLHTDRQKAGEIIGFCNLLALSIGSLIASLLIIYAVPLSRSALLDLNLTGTLRIGAGMVFIGTLIGVGSGTLAGFQDFRGLAVASAVEGVTVLLTTIPLTKQIGLDGAVLAIVIAQIAKLLYIRHRLATCFRLHEVIPVYIGHIRHINVLWTYSLPAFLSGFMYGPAIWGFNRMIIAQPEGYKMLGVMTAAEQWKTLILFVPAALGNVIMPLLASIHGSANKSYSAIVYRNITGQLLLAVIVAIPIVIMNKYIVGAYGSSFENLSTIITITCATAILHVLGNSAGNALMTANSIWPNLFINAIWATCLISIGYIFIEKYDVIGIACAYLLAQLIHGILTLFVAIKYQDEKTNESH